jgi:hypothetical protein
VRQRPGCCWLLAVHVSSGKVPEVQRELGGLLYRGVRGERKSAPPGGHFKNSRPAPWPDNNLMINLIITVKYMLIIRDSLIINVSPRRGLPPALPSAPRARYAAHVLHAKGAAP